MYISNKTLFAHSQDRIKKANKELYQLQEVLSSGKKINRPSDDPAGARQVLHYRSILSTINQYSENIDFGQDWCQATNDTLDTANQLLLRCRELAQTQADSTATKESRSASATEIDGIYQDLLGLANSKYDGRYLFAPESMDSPPFNQDAEEQTDSPEFLMRIKIGDEKDVQLNASRKVFTGGENGQNIFEAVDQLKTSLQDNDPDAIREAWAKVDQSLEQITQEQGKTGVKLQRLDRHQGMLDTLKNMTETSLSQKEDADLVEKAIEFLNKSNNYEINLTTLSKILHTNLLDLLR